MIIDEGTGQTTIRGVTISDNSKRIDGWGNALMGLGKRSIDKTENTYYGDYPRFEDDELTSLYIGEGVGKQIVDKAADDMTRQWITIENDEDEAIQNTLDLLEAESTVNKALKWARLYRGSIIVMLTSIGTLDDMSKPLPVSAEITGLRVYSAARINVNTTDIMDNVNSQYFDDIEVYRIQRRNGTEIQVHSSRCLKFKGTPAPDEDQTLDFKYRYWGLPVLQSVWSRLRNFGAIEKGVANLMMEVVVGKYTLSNLAQILAQNDEASLEQIYNRIDIINASKSLINAVLLGEDESYERDAANLSGIPDVIDRFMVMIAAVADYPVTKLWGRSPAGMNATGESDIRNYYDSIKSKQKLILRDPLQFLVNRIAQQLKKSGTHPIEFNPLWQPTEKEQAEMEKIEAETFAIYIDKGVLTAEDVQEQKFPELAVTGEE